MIPPLRSKSRTVSDRTPAASAAGQTGALQMRIAMLLLGIFLAAAVAGPIFATGQSAASLADRNLPPGAQHLLGTDDTGADVLRQLALGARTALIVGGGATSIGMSLGVIVGSLMGLAGRWADMAGMRLIEIQSAVPRLLLLLVVMASLGAAGQGRIWVLMAVMGLLGWVRPARLLRAEMQRVRASDFVSAAIIAGTAPARRLFVHVLPASAAPLIVDASFTMAGLVLMEAALSFLGVGLVPPVASWGQTLAGAVDAATGEFRWWLAVFPGGLILSLVWSLNTIGEALRDRLYPEQTL